MEMKCSSSRLAHESTNGTVFPAHRFDLTIIYMTDKRVTSWLLRPFFSLDLLRFILLNKFHIQFEVAPIPAPRDVIEPPAKVSSFACDGPTDDEEGEFFYDASDELRILCETSDSTWSFSSRVHMYLPIPPRILTSCLSLFVGEQLASPDDLRMMVNFLSSLGRDMKMMEARLARAEGEAHRAQVLEHDAHIEQHINEKEHNQVRDHRVERRKTRSQKRCTIC